MAKPWAEQESMALVRRVAQISGNNGTKFLKLKKIERGEGGGCQSCNFRGQNVDTYVHRWSR